MVSAIVLAGGESLRFGRRKALFSLLGKPMISYVLSAVSRVADQILIAVDEAAPFRAAIDTAVFDTRVEIVEDSLSGSNPLNGLLSAAVKLQSGFSLVVPCDTPLLNTRLLQFLIDEVKGADAVIPRWETGYIEPIHAVYKIEALRRVIHVFTKNSNISFYQFLKKLKNVNFVSINKLKRLDPHLLTFLNVNTIKDYTKVKKILLNEDNSRLTS